MILRERYRAVAYAVAVVVVVIAGLARLFLTPLWGSELPFFTFYPAILVAAYLGGLGPGLLATALSGAMVTWLWLRPGHLLLPAAFGDRLALGLFLCIGSLMSALTEGLHRARASAAAMVRALSTATAARNRTEEERSRYAERLEILHDIDRAIMAAEAPEAIAAAALPRLRDVLGVPRAIVNLFDLHAGEVEWLAAIGRHRVRRGPGVRYSLDLAGDVDALRRGEPQVMDVASLPPSPEADALLASGVRVYMVVPMIARGELIGSVSFGGASAEFSPDQVSIAREVATQLAIAIAQARLHERVQRQAEELEHRVRERTAELEAAQEELVRTERLAILGRLAGGISHELRNPLGVIKNSVYYLRMLIPDDERFRKHLGILEREAVTANRLVSGLLDFARVVPPDRTATDLSDLVRGFLAEAGVPDTVIVTLDLAAELPHLWIDKHQARLILGNLVSNAVQAMPEGGTLTISTSRENAAVILAVTDTGSGIPSENLAKIFEPLFSTKARGIGFGLAVVKSLAEANGAEVYVESAVGQGSRFTVLFPGGR